MECIVENAGDSIGYIGLTQNTGRIVIIDQASRFRALRGQDEDSSSDESADFTSTYCIGGSKSFESKFIELCLWKGCSLPLDDSSVAFKGFGLGSVSPA